MFTYSDIFSNKQRILIITAHPDDSLVFFGGLMQRLCEEKKDVYVLVVTNGARGSRDNEISEEKLAKLRLEEERTALHALGIPVEHVASLGYLDGEVESDMRLIGLIAKAIRTYKADIVCTHEPALQYLATYSKEGYFVQHRDHRKVGEAVIDAVYPFSRDRSFFPEHFSEGLEPHSVFDILLTDEKECNFDFDLTENLELKRNAMRLHKSQFDEETVIAITDAFKFDGKYLERFNYIKLLW